MKNLRRNSRCSNQDSNTASRRYKREALPLGPTISIIIHIRLKTALFSYLKHFQNLEGLRFFRISCHITKTVILTNHNCENLAYYCTMLGLLDQFCSVVVCVTPLKTPFGLLIPLLQSQSHVTTITQLFLTLCHVYTAYNHTRS
jgi:hypothetical protein